MSEWTHEPRLLDASGDWIAARAFVDAGVYELETRRVFARSWLYLCHASEVRMPGDFAAARMATDSVVVARQPDGTLAASLNLCSHRGHPVVEEQSGTRSSFSCGYHGWCYGLDGTFEGAPPGTGPAPAESLNLRRVPRVEEVSGLVFGCWDPAATPLVDHLGPMAWYLGALDAYLGDNTIVLDGPQRWRIGCNWKLPAENFAGDLAHAPVTHASAVSAAGLPVGSSPPGLSGIGRQFSSGEGHGAVCVYPEVGAFGGQLVERAAAARRDRVPPVKWMAGKGSGTVFPNFSYFGNAQTVRTWNPDGPDSVEVWSWVLGDAALSVDERRAVVDSARSTFGEGGSFQKDDDRNWSSVQRTLRGAAGRQGGLHVGSCLTGLAVDVDGLPGVTADAFGELSRRGFLRRWGQLMDDGPVHDPALETAFRAELGLIDPAADR